MEKVIYVKARFRPITEEVTVKVPTGEKKKGFFGEKDVTRKEKQTRIKGYSDSEIDGELLADELQEAIHTLNNEGYTVSSVTPISSGAYNYRFSSKGITSSPRIISNNEAVSGGGSFGYGYGYSYTESLIVLGTKDER